MLIIWGLSFLAPYFGKNTTSVLGPNEFNPNDFMRVKKWYLEAEIFFKYFQFLGAENPTVLYVSGGNTQIIAYSEQRYVLHGLVRKAETR